MLRPRAPYLASLVASIVLAVLMRIAEAALKAIFDVTVQDHWKDSALPFLTAHVGPWSTAVLEWIGPYWGGFASAFALMFAVEMMFAWSRKRRGLDADSANGFNPIGRRRAERVAQAAAECRRIAEDMQQFIADQTEMPWSDQGRVQNHEAYTIAFQRHCEARATRFRARFAVRAGEAVERASHLVTVSGLERHDATNFVTAPAIQEMQATVFATLSARLHAMLPVPPSAPSPPRDVQYDLQNNGAEWSLYLTNLGTTGDFHVRLDLSSLPSDWPGKPTGAVRGAWGSNQCVGR